MSIARNASLNLVSQLLNSVLPVAVSVIVARVLGPAGSGTYNYLLYLVAIGVALATLGLPSSITRFAALMRAEGRSDTARAVTAAQCRLGVALSSLVALAALVAALLGFSPAGSSATDIALLSVLVLLTGTGVLLGAVLAGEERYGDLLRISAVIAPLTFLVNVGALSLRSTVTSLLLSLVVATFVQVGLLVRSTARAGATPFARGALPRDVRREVRAFALPVSVVVVLDVIVWQRSEVLFLEYFSSTEEIAYYALPFGIVSRLMLTLPGALTGVLLPRFSAQLGDADSGSGQGTYRRSAQLTAWLAAPLAVFGGVFAEPIVDTLYGDAFSPAAVVLRILLVSGALAALGSVGAAAAYGGGRQAFVLASSSVVAVLNIILDLVLIPQYDALGAAVANGVSQAIGLTMGFTYLARRAALPLPLLALGRVFGLAGAAVLPASLWLLTPLPSGAVVVGGGVTYLAGYALLSRLMPSDVRDVTSLMFRRIRDAVPRRAAGPR